MVAALLLLCATAAADPVETGIRRQIDIGYYDVGCVGRVGGGKWCVGGSTNSIFEIASVSKTFTALTVLRLADEGKIDLDAPFTKYLTDHVLARTGTDVTIRDLASHSSGFTDRWMAEAGIYGREKSPFKSDAEYFAKLLSVTPSAGRRTGIRYACTNFILLGLVVERVTGTDLGTAAKKYVFDPLGMRDTRWGRPVDVNRCVQIYTHGPRPLGTIGDENARGVSRPLGNAGVFTTLDDLLKYADDLLSRRTFSAKCYDTLFTLEAVDGRRRRSFGWDMAAGTNPPGWSDRAINHTGYSGQYLAIDPARHAAVVALTNLRVDDRPGRSAAYEARRSLAALAAAQPPAWEERWNREELYGTPRVHRVPEFDTNGVEAVMIESLPWKGRPTRAFAYVALPEAARHGGRVPGVVLVHGGLSTASAAWAKSWAERGYAAIAADNCGGTPVAEPDGSWRRHAFSGPRGWGRFATCGEPLRDQWFCHAVAVNALAHSYLRSLAAVDPERTGLVGGSWGGLLSCAIAAVDRRFKCVVPIFGCGYLGMHHFVSWRLGMQNATAEQGLGWQRLWDPALFLPYVKCPFLWVDGTNDFHFQLDMVARSAALVEDSAFTTIPRLPHGSEGTTRPEIAEFVNHCLKGGPDVVRFRNCRTENGRLVASFTTGGRKIARARLVWTVSSDADWTKRFYDEKTLDGFDAASGEVSAALPAGTTVAFVALDTEDGFTFGTPAVFGR